jgi:hypothetical protein
MSALRRQLFWWYAGLFLSITSRWPIGQNIYEEDWDMLIILDACRVDALREVAPEYSFINTVDKRMSVGSHSREWIAKTFTEKYKKEIGQTTYVTSNLNVKKVLEERKKPESRREKEIPFSFSSYDFLHIDDFDHLDPVWEYTKHEWGGGFPPDIVTDRAVKLARERPRKKLIVHYMQPHNPYIGTDEPIMELNQEGKVNRETLWEAYLDTLRCALDEVKKLINNVDANKTIITADHGEALWERGVYGHDLTNPMPEVKQVPWVETTARDTGSYNPSERLRGELTDEEIKERLADLGYV